MPSFGIEILDKPPYLKMQISSLKLLARIRASQTTSPPRSLIIRSNKKNSHHILSNSAPTSCQKVNSTKGDSSLVLAAPSPRVSAPKPQSYLTHNMPHHMSLQHLHLSKSTDFENPIKASQRPMSVRVKTSSSLYSLPSFPPEASVTVSPRSASSNRLSHHEPLTEPQISAKPPLVKEASLARLSLICIFICRLVPSMKKAFILFIYVFLTFVSLGLILLQP